MLQSKNTEGGVVFIKYSGYSHLTYRFAMPVVARIKTYVRNMRSCKCRVPMRQIVKSSWFSAAFDVGSHQLLVVGHSGKPWKHGNKVLCDKISLHQESWNAKDYDAVNYVVALATCGWIKMNAKSKTKIAVSIYSYTLKDSQKCSIFSKEIIGTFFKCRTLNSS